MAVKNPLEAHPPWRQLVIVSVALPLVVVLAVLAFTWPNARIAPRDLPVGVIGSTAATQQVITALDHARPGGFDFRLYPNEAIARSAIRHRDVYGAFAVTAGRFRVLEAGAASPAVAQLLTTVGRHIASATHTTSGGHKTQLSIDDVVGLSRADPKGIVLSSALLPLTICSIIVASVIGAVVRFRPAWRQVLAVVIVSAIAGAGGYLIGQVWLGAFPRHGARDWATLALTIAAIAAPTAGLIALIGAAGLGLAAALFVFVGNPFAGASSAPELLPAAARHLGQSLPPGAGLSLLRSSAYFDGNGSGSHLAVLIAWTVAGFLAVAIGHHAPIRFAAALPRGPETRTAAHAGIEAPVLGAR